MEYHHASSQSQGNPTSSSSSLDEKPQGAKKPVSKGELLSSAKAVAEAAKSSISHDQGKPVDKGKVAGAAADLLGAASHYGKLEEKGGLGKYVGKAETYLHQYHATHATTTPPAAAAAPANSTTTHHQQPAPAASGGGKNKYGDYIKKAEGLLKHQSGSGTASGPAGSGGSGSGSGYGDYVKIAGQFLKKH